MCAGHAGVAELVDAGDSKSPAARLVGSSPTTRTIGFFWPIAALNEASSYLA